MPNASKGKLTKPETLIEKPDTWAEDQKEKGYYYDDSHGYETYEPETDDGDCEKPEADNANPLSEAKT